MKVRSGSIHILVAYDLAFEIRLPQIPVLFGNRERDAARFAFLSKGVQRETQPVTLFLDSVRLELDGVTRDFDVSVSFFDVGAISLEFMANIEDIGLDQLPRVAAAIQSSPHVLAKAQQIAQSVAEQAKPALVSPGLANLASVYTVFAVRKHEGSTHVDGIVRQLGPFVAQTLRASEDRIGERELESALTPFVTYSDQDVLFASTNVAVLFDETASDVVDIFELANAQSAELRYVDARLDRALQKLYEDNEERPTLWQKLTNVFEAQLKRLNTLHLDATIIVDRVENSFKFAQDSYLVQIHELAIRKMLMQSFLHGIERKLTAVREVVSDLRDRSSTTRMEILEWIVIILIAIEVIPALLKGLH
jgi:hypothetical protein